MKVEIWRTEAWCAMITGWVPPEAIPYAFDANSKECWHCGKKRHSILNGQCHDVSVLHLAAKHEKARNERIAEEKSAADAAAAEGRNKMPKQYPGAGPKPPLEIPEKIEFKPRWSEQEYVEGPYEQSAKKKAFWGDGDHCFRINS